MSALDTFIEEFLVSILVTSYDEDDDEHYIVFQKGQQLEEENLLYVHPTAFVKTIAKIRQNKETYLVGIIGQEGYAAEWQDVTNTSFLYSLQARAMGICAWYFKDAHNAKPGSKPTKKQKPKSKKKGSGLSAFFKETSTNNVVPFRPKPKGRKGRKGRR
jgi:hypothetical protein